MGYLLHILVGLRQSFAKIINNNSYPTQMHINLHLTPLPHQKRHKDRSKTQEGGKADHICDCGEKDG